MSHVTLEHRCCVVCENLYPTEAIILDRKLRDTAFSDDNPLVTGYGLCPKHKALRDDGYITLIEIIPPEGDSTSITIDTVKRTGNFVHILHNTFVAIFDADPPATGIAYMDTTVIDTLKSIIQSQETIH